MAGTAIYNYGSDTQTTVCRRAHAERLSVHDRQSQRKTGLRGASPETIMTGRPGGGGARYDYRACRVAATIRRSITNSDCYPRWLRWAAARRQGGAAVAFENRCSRFVAKLVPEGRFVRWSHYRNKSNCPAGCRNDGAVVPPGRHNRDAHRNGMRAAAAHRGGDAARMSVLSKSFPAASRGVR